VPVLHLIAIIVSQFIIIKIITSVQLSAPKLNTTSLENETSGSDTSSDKETLEDSVCEFLYSYSYSKIGIDKKNKNKIKLYWYKEISRSIIPQEHQLEWPYIKLALSRDTWRN